MSVRPMKREARRGWNPRRATAGSCEKRIPHRRKDFDMVRDDPEEWERGTLAAGMLLAVALGIGMVVCA